jgi:hypothetical protein
MIAISSHPIAGSIDVKALSCALPFGVFSVQGPIRSAHTISHGVVSAILRGKKLPYWFTVFFNVVDTDEISDDVPVHPHSQLWPRLIVERIVTSVR